MCLLDAYKHQRFDGESISETGQARRRSYGGGFTVEAECCRGWRSGARRKFRYFFEQLPLVLAVFFKALATEVAQPKLINGIRVP
jgi:hypothetical protein